MQHPDRDVLLWKIFGEFLKFKFALKSLQQQQQSCIGWQASL